MGHLIEMLPGTNQPTNQPCMSWASDSPRMSSTLDSPAHSRARRTEGASGRATTLWVGCVAVMKDGVEVVMVWDWLSVEFCLQIKLDLQMCQERV